MHDCLHVGPTPIPGCTGCMPTLHVVVGNVWSIEQNWYNSIDESV